MPWNALKNIAKQYSDLKMFNKTNYENKTFTFTDCRFYPRWKEYEMIQAALLNYTLAETQWEEDWTSLLSLASQPGSSLEQIHIFALSHILRRPIIVYGVKFVKSFRGEDIGYARFEGLYLPLLWEQSFCIKSPIALGYTRGHFSALVPTEPYCRIDAARDDSEDVTFLPLMDCEQKLLPIHFLTQNEVSLFFFSKKNQY